MKSINYLNYISSLQEIQMIILFVQLGENCFKYSKFIASIGKNEALNSYLHPSYNKKIQPF
jgi:hypothetical protein